MVFRPLFFVFLVLLNSIVLYDKDLWLILMGKRVFSHDFQMRP
jgi:hypothetical protein